MRRCQHRIEVAIDQALSAHAVTFAQYRVLVLLELTGLVRRFPMGHVTEVELTPFGRKQLGTLQGLVDTPSPNRSATSSVSANRSS